MYSATSFIFITGDASSPSRREASASSALVLDRVNDLSPAISACKSDGDVFRAERSPTKDGQLISAIPLSRCPSSAAHFASRCVICPNTGPKPIVINVYPSAHSYTLGTCTPAIVIAPCERLPSGFPEPGTSAWPNEPIIAAILADTSARCPSLCVANY